MNKWLITVIIVFVVAAYGGAMLAQDHSVFSIIAAVALLGMGVLAIRIILNME